MKNESLQKADLVSAFCFFVHLAQSFFCFPADYLALGYTYFLSSRGYNGYVPRGTYPRRGSLGDGRERNMGKAKKYDKCLPAKMYSFFRSYSDIGAPSIAKFAVSIGATVADIERFRKYREFERAYRECSEIRRDYLIDNALCKRFDSSLTKFLLSTEYGMGEEDDGGGRLDVRVEVIE